MDPYVVSLMNLKVKVPEDVFATVVKALIKILTNIKTYPEERKFRRLKLDNKLVVEFIAPFQESIGMLRSIGFAEIDGYLEITEALIIEKIDSIEKTINALKSVSV